METKYTPAEQLANDLLNAAGSNLRHYMPQTKKSIISVAQKAIDNIERERAINSELVEVAETLRMGFFAAALSFRGDTYKSALEICEDAAKIIAKAKGEAE